MGQGSAAIGNNIFNVFKAGEAGIGLALDVQ